MIALRELRESPELRVRRVETASTAVSPIISPETAPRAVLASVEREKARVLEATIAIDAVNLATWLETAPTPRSRVLVLQAEVETASDAASWATWLETAPTAKPLLSGAEDLDREIASSAASPVTWPETAELKKLCFEEERERK